MLECVTVMLITIIYLKLIIWARYPRASRQPLSCPSGLPAVIPAASSTCGHGRPDRGRVAVCPAGRKEDAKNFLF